ncbi:MAG: rhodanese-like domain-containing protein [Gammaproteobacteria bacterium]|nr:rhodanese-like domain-containing protein [Gammaproteobacteria bacterium]
MDQIVEFITNNVTLVIAWVVLFALLLVSFTRTSSKVIGNQQITTMMNRENAVIIDIRSKADYAKGHLLGSINIPTAQLKDADKDLEKHTDCPIILVDANGMHAAAATQQLQKMGKQQLYRMQGGIVSWTNDNLPLSNS